MSYKRFIKISDIPMYDIKNIPSTEYNKSPKAVKSGEDIKALQDSYDVNSPTKDSIKNYD